MKRWPVLLCLLALPCGASHASGSELPDESPRILPQVTVRLYNNAGVPPEELVQATEIAQKILRQVGVQVVWWTCAGATDMLQCEDSLQAADYRAILVPREAETKMPVSRKGLGFVLDDPRHGVGRTTWLLYDRVRELSARKGVAPSFLLGHVLAHELGHLLLGSAEHPASGLMRGRWQNQDLRLATQGALQFSGWEASAIRAAVHDRPIERPSLLTLVSFVPR